MAKKPMNMKQWEKSKMDEKMDKSGKYGKEGSKKEQAADKKALKAYNKKAAKKKKK
jgi:hypothetical protein